MWHENGIYIAAKVDGIHETDQIPEVGERLNQGYAVQFNMYSNRDAGFVEDECAFIIFHPNTKGGGAVREHYLFGDMTNGADVPGAKVGAVMLDNGYTITGLIPDSMLKMTTVPFDLRKGGKIYNLRRYRVYFRRTYHLHRLGLGKRRRSPRIYSYRHSGRIAAGRRNTARSSGRE